MFDLYAPSPKNCSGTTRRELIRVGALTAFGLNLPDVLRVQAARAEGKEISCIFLWLTGGPSHHDTFDPKPMAPAEVRGEFGFIPAKNGVQFTDQVPLLAKNSDLFSLIRSMTHSDGNHDTAQFQMQSGYKFNVTMNYPSFGSVVGREKGVRNGLPPYMLFAGKGSGSEGAGYLGAVNNPFTIAGDPSKSDFSVRDVNPPSGVNFDRLGRRREMLAALDRFQKKAEVRTKTASSVDQFRLRATDLITSPAAKRAFALSEEPQALRDRYGKHALGQSCLLARRLVEAGVRFVTINNGAWDTHQNNFYLLKTQQLPKLDQAYSALLNDLKDRGLLDTTLVLCLGEFGRTPGVNSQAGRDHWSNAFSACIGGGGVKMGKVIGASDDTGAMPADRPVRPEDFAATVYRALGVDYTREYDTPQGRPTPIVYNGEPVSELL